MNRNALKSPADVPVCRHTCDGIYIRHKDYFRKYLYSDLLWVKASGCYCDLYFRDKSRLTVAFPLAVVTADSLAICLSVFTTAMSSASTISKRFSATPCG